MVTITAGKNGNGVYHTEECQGVQQIYQTEEISQSDAEDRGLTECEKCAPSPDPIGNGDAVVPKACGSNSVYHTHWCSSAQQLDNPKTWSIEYVKRGRAGLCKRCEQIELK